MHIFRYATLSSFPLSFAKIDAQTKPLPTAGRARCQGLEKKDRETAHPQIDGQRGPGRSFLP
ncbi:MAG: hypothetical protein ACYC6S_13760, partial [Desulfobulbia bacterium]